MELFYSDFPGSFTRPLLQRRGSLNLIKNYKNEPLIINFIAYKRHNYPFTKREGYCGFVNQTYCVSLSVFSLDVIYLVWTSLSSRPVSAHILPSPCHRSLPWPVRRTNYRICCESGKDINVIPLQLHWPVETKLCPLWWVCLPCRVSAGRRTAVTSTCQLYCPQEIQDKNSCSQCFICEFCHVMMSCHDCWWNAAVVSWVCSWELRTVRDCIPCQRLFTSLLSHFKMCRMSIGSTWD